MTDEQAEALGRELAGFIDPMAGEIPSDIVISLGRIAVKLAEPYVLERLREPNAGQVTAAMVWAKEAKAQLEPITIGYQRMIGARLAEIKEG